MTGLLLGMPAIACDASCKRTAIDEYFQRLDQVSRAGSSSADIDRLFELFSDDVKYEHIEYEADFDRTSWRRAFARNLERGAYDAPASRAIGVLQSIDGKQHMAVQYAHGTRDENGDWKQSDKPGVLILFGFSGERISLVREYW